MKFFLTDLWNDLREKRLWPVALALLAGLIAVPVALTKRSEEPAATPPVETEARTAPEPKELKGLARVKVESSAVNSGSRLDTFDPSNPFRPPSKVLEASQEGSQASATQSGPGPDSGSSGSTGSSGSSGSAGGPAGDTGSIVTPAPYTGGTSGGGDTRSRPRTSQYTFVVDATFIANGRKRKVEGMERLDMLPHRASPLLLFLGVSANAGRAVFLVDSTLQAAGEGTCKPGGDRCAFLYIGPGSEHEFVNDQGDSFTLRIKEIRKVQVKRRSADASKKKTKGAASRASSHRRFVPPVLADLISVSSPRERRENDRGRRR
jgi:hypothetical protein